MIANHFFLSFFLLFFFYFSLLFASFSVLSTLLYSFSCRAARFVHQFCFDFSHSFHFMLLCLVLFMNCLLHLRFILPWFVHWKESEYNSVDYSLVLYATRIFIVENAFRLRSYDKQHQTEWNGKHQNYSPHRNWTDESKCNWLAIAISDIVYRLNANSLGYIHYMIDLASKPISSIQKVKATPNNFNE